MHLRTTDPAQEPAARLLPNPTTEGFPSRVASRTSPPRADGGRRPPAQRCASPGRQCWRTRPGHTLRTPAWLRRGLGGQVPTHWPARGHTDLTVLLLPGLTGRTLSTQAGLVAPSWGHYVLGLFIEVGQPVTPSWPNPLLFHKLTPTARGAGPPPKAPAHARPGCVARRVLTALVVVLRGLLERPVVALLRVGLLVAIVTVSCKHTGTREVSSPTRGPKGTARS